MSVNTHRLLLDEVDHHFQRGIHAREQDDHAAASLHFKRSAASLLRLAQITREPDLKAQRLDQAERMAAMATVPLPRKPPQRSPVVPPAVSPEVSPTRPAPREAAVELGDDAQFIPSRRPDLHLRDVAGLADAKREIRLRMIEPFTHPELARQWGLRPGGGMLLYGPPGTGKTFLARATAGELDAPFFAIKAGDIMTKWVGEAEQRVSELFATARREDKAVIFIDEIEALLPARANNGSTVMARVVPQFLAELDGFEKHNHSLLFIGATNEPWSLDPAVLRPGRLDVHVLIDLPDVMARFEMLKKRLSDKPFAADLDLAALAEASEGLSGADLDGYSDRVAKTGFERHIKGDPEPLTQADMLAALAAVRPSVNDQQRARFRRFAA